ncbi:YadA C-terminal domain-containing protein [Fusobacterium nucleatum]|uniref:YadA C-terminal domain-containing protein n=1 Tax=Fusobacterium nucleatum TaxID=851 RepID=UPI0030D4E0E0
MKNKLFNIIIFSFLLNSVNIFSLDSDIKEIEPIESIHSDQNASSFADDNIKTFSENSFEENYSPNKSKISNIVSTNKDLKTNKKEENNGEDKFEEITDRTNRITALGSAMGAVDLSKTPANKFRVGAGVGHSAKNQAVAVGIGYAPTERLRLNTKISTTTNSTKSSRSNGISIGASYDLDW